MKLAILIVLYNQQPHESTTLQSLLDADLSHLKEVQLVLWNNGPQLLLERPLKAVQVALAKKNITTFLYDTTENYSLAKIYNHFTKKKGFTHYILFDQDSTFAPNFFTKLSKAKDSDLILPIIYEEQSEQYLWPREIISRSNTVPILTEGLYTKSRLEFPNSGTCFSTGFIGAFQKKISYLFNEAFGIYGVDVCFYTDTATVLSENKELTVYFTNTLYHRLSNFSSTPDAIASTRKIEQVYEHCLLRLYTYKKSFRSALSFFIREGRRRFNFSEKRAYLKCLLLRRHPHNTNKKNIKFIKDINSVITLHSKNH